VVVVDAAPKPLVEYGYRGELTFASDPIPHDGWMQLTSVGKIWLGQLKSHGWYISIAGRDAASVIDGGRWVRG
jgi:hypothetical protein